MSKKPLLLRRLDYVFITGVLQQHVQKIDILPSILSDHSPVFLNIDYIVNDCRGKGYWKFNNMLLRETKFINGVKNIISELNNSTELPSAQIKWEMLKYRIVKFPRKY